MTSWLNTTAYLTHTTPLPPGVPFATLLAHLHNHDLCIRLDPEFSSYETLPSDEATPDTKRYKVTDHMHALPRGIWDSTVTFISEMTNTENSLIMVVKAPLGLLQRSEWKLVRAEDMGKGKEKVVEEEGNGSNMASDRKTEWYLVEEVEIKASRLLVGVVKGKCEENWRGTHARWVEGLKGKDGKV